MNGKDSQSLNGALVLVGGAGDAGGYWAAKAALDLGATVVLLDKDSAQLNHTYDTLCRESGLNADSKRMAIYPFDPEQTDGAEYQKIPELLLKEYGRLDHVIHNCAALCPPQGLDEVSPRDWYRLFQLNLHYPWLLQRSLLSAQSKRINPRMIFLLEDIDKPWLGAYALGRSAQLQMVRIWSKELKPGRQGTGPVVSGLICTGLATRAQSYYFPGVLPRSLPSLKRIYTPIQTLLTGSPNTVHGKIESWSRFDNPSETRSIERPGD